MRDKRKVICAHNFFSPDPKRIPGIQKVVIFGSSHIAHEAISIRNFFEKEKKMRKRPAIWNSLNDMSVLAHFMSCISPNVPYGKLEELGKMEMEDMERALQKYVQCACKKNCTSMLSGKLREAKRNCLLRMQSLPIEADKKKVVFFFPFLLFRPYFTA